MPQPLECRLDWAEAGALAAGFRLRVLGAGPEELASAVEEVFFAALLADCDRAGSEGEAREMLKEMLP